MSAAKRKTRFNRLGSRSVNGRMCANSNVILWQVCESYPYVQMKSLRWFCRSPGHRLWYKSKRKGRSRDKLGFLVIGHTLNRSVYKVFLQLHGRIQHHHQRSLWRTKSLWIKDWFPCEGLSSSSDSLHGRLKPLSVLDAWCAQLAVSAWYIGSTCHQDSANKLLHCMGDCIRVTLRCLLL